MGHRVYICPIPTVSIGTAVQDICAIIGTAAVGITVHQIHLGANVSAESALYVRVKRGSATVTAGSGGSAGAPVPVDPKDAAAVAAVRLNDTTQATTSGAFVNMAYDYWDTALPWDLFPSPEDRERAAVSGAIILDLPATITAVTIAGWVKYSESP